MGIESAQRILRILSALQAEGILGKASPEAKDPADLSQKRSSRLTSTPLSVQSLFYTWPARPTTN